jgi:hypothetical protein
MKKFLILTLLLLSSFFGFSQNGGQFFENNVIRLTVIGYSNGQYIFSVFNKQTCTATIRTKADTDQAVDYNIPPGDSILIFTTRPSLTQIKFRAKAETACVSNPDMGWLEIVTTLGTLNLVENNHITIVRGPNTYFVSLVGGVLKSNFGSLSENQHIVIYNISGLILYQRKSFVKKTDQIDLNFCLRPGLNFVRVFIDNKFRDNFTFKVYKN